MSLSSRLVLTSLLVLAHPAWACQPLTAEAAATLSLPQALARVPDCHPDLRAARLAVDAAAADIRTAGQRPNPQLGIGANSVGRSLGSGNLWNKTFDHQVRVDQLIERGNKRGLRTVGAEALRDAARADAEDAARLARLAVARAHADLLATLARRDALRAFGQLSAESLRLLDLRVRAGDAPPLDATRLRLDDSRLQGDLRQADADTAAQRLQLAQLIGALPVAEALVPVADAAAADAPAQAVTTTAPRADVAAAAARLRAAEAARDLARAQRTRDISVGLQFDRYPATAANPSGNGNTVSVGISLPLFVHHAYDGEIARAEADVLQAGAALDRVRAAAEADAARARAQLDAAQQRRMLARDSLLPAAQKLAAGAELAYQRGGLGALDLVEARRGLRAAQLERLAADADQARALADWEAATAPADLPPVAPTSASAAPAAPAAQR